MSISWAAIRMVSVIHSVILNGTRTCSVTLSATSKLATVTVDGVLDRAIQCTSMVLMASSSQATYRILTRHAQYEVAALARSGLKRC